MLPYVLSLTCLTAMLTLTELMEPSIRTFSLSLRLMITGWRSNSLLLLEVGRNTHNSFWFNSVWFNSDFIHYLVLIASVLDSKLQYQTHRTSTSGLLCLSTTCEEKFSRQRAACRVARTALRYGRNVAVWGRKKRWWESFLKKSESESTGSLLNTYITMYKLSWVSQCAVGLT